MNSNPAKRGRPKSKNSLSAAERSKKSRDKKKLNNLVTINSTLSERNSILYRRMVAQGVSLNSMINMAYSYLITLDE
jgi:hypothetical protein